MSPTGSLVRHSLRRHRAFLAAVCLSVAAVELFVIVAARSLEMSGRFSLLGGMLPDFIARLTNMALVSFRGFVLFGYSHPTVLLFLIAMAIAIGSEPAAEVESRFVDLMMARSVSRGAVIRRSVIVLVVATSLAIASMIAATFGGLRMLAPPTARVPEPRVILSLAANLGLVVIAWGAIALALASLAKRRVTAAVACGLLAFATFILDYVGRFWDAVKGISRISPFHYFSPFEMIAGRPLRMTDVAVLIAIAIAASVLAHAAYARRDI